MTEEEDEQELRERRLRRRVRRPFEGLALWNPGRLGLPAVLITMSSGLAGGVAFVVLFQSEVVRTSFLLPLPFRGALLLFSAPMFLVAAIVAWQLSRRLGTMRRLGPALVRVWPPMLVVAFGVLTLNGVLRLAERLGVPVGALTAPGGTHLFHIGFVATCAAFLVLLSRFIPVRPDSWLVSRVVPLTLSLTLVLAGCPTGAAAAWAIHQQHSNAAGALASLDGLHSELTAITAGGKWAKLSRDETRERVQRLDEIGRHASPFATEREWHDAEAQGVDLLEPTYAVIDAVGTLLLGRLDSTPGAVLFGDDRPTIQDVKGGLADPMSADGRRTLGDVRWWVEPTVSEQLELIRDYYAATGRIWDLLGASLLQDRPSVRLARERYERYNRPAEPAWLCEGVDPKERCATHRLVSHFAYSWLRDALDLNGESGASDSWNATLRRRMDSEPLDREPPEPLLAGDVVHLLRLPWRRTKTDFPECTSVWPISYRDSTYALLECPAFAWEGTGRVGVVVRLLWTTRPETLPNSDATPELVYYVAVPAKGVDVLQSRSAFLSELSAATYLESSSTIDNMDPGVPGGGTADNGFAIRAGGTSVLVNPVERTSEDWHVCPKGATGVDERCRRVFEVCASARRGACGENRMKNGTNGP